MDANVDIYKQMSSLIRNKPVESITAQERAQFKQVTLALLYGMSPNQVAKKLNITKSQAIQMMNDFFRRFQGELDVRLAFMLWCYLERQQLNT